MTFNPVYKSAKLVKMDLETLCCRLTHCVRLQYEDFSENDELYVIYGRHAGQEASFMRKWLHFFITEAYKKYFVSSGYQYLYSKGMDPNMWSESIIDGRKADFFCITCNQCSTGNAYNGTLKEWCNMVHFRKPTHGSQ